MGSDYGENCIPCRETTKPHAHLYLHTVAPIFLIILRVQGCANKRRVHGVPKVRRHSQYVEFTMLHKAIIKRTLGRRASLTTVHRATPLSMAPPSRLDREIKGILKTRGKKTKNLEHLGQRQNK